MRVSSATAHRSPALIDRQRQRRAFSAVSRRPSAAEPAAEPAHAVHERDATSRQPPAPVPELPHQEEFRNVTDPDEERQAAGQSTVVTIHVVDKPRKGSQCSLVSSLLLAHSGCSSPKRFLLPLQAPH